MTPSYECVFEMDFVKSRRDKLSKKTLLLLQDIDTTSYSIGDVCRRMSCGLHIDHTEFMIKKIKLKLMKFNVMLSLFTDYR